MKQLEFLLLLAELEGKAVLDCKMKDRLQLEMHETIDFKLIWQYN